MVRALGVGPAIELGNGRPRAEKQERQGGQEGSDQMTTRLARNARMSSVV